jgi:hypothetical protein
VNDTLRGLVESANQAVQEGAHPDKLTFVIARIKEIVFKIQEIDQQLKDEFIDTLDTESLFKLNTAYTTMQTRFSTISQIAENARLKFPWVEENSDSMEILSTASALLRTVNKHQKHLKEILSCVGRCGSAPRLNIGKKKLRNMTVPNLVIKNQIMSSPLFVEAARRNISYLQEKQREVVPPGDGANSEYLSYGGEGSDILKMRTLVQFLSNDSALCTEGVFRLSPRKDKFKEIEAGFVANISQGYYKLPEEASVHDVALLLKNVLKKAVLDKAFREEMADILHSANSDEQKEQEVLRLFHSLPLEQRGLVAMVLNHLKKVSDNSSINKMSLQNLAVIFAPALFICSSNDAKEYATQCARAVDACLCLMEAFNKKKDAFNF